ncbi:AAA family ATPase [Nocardioides sp. zg-536]|uniref:AAA family ATPase n=2 Tax=Nocardioides faecalis TaxID=2803858 RepID=A0A938Y9Z9_9ACTN|nr:AAA family ATPase [Nocardioides faecalis]QVI58026.1 AAA family ATPase [Nocardioides faecalis]
MRVMRVDFERLLGFKDVSIELDPELQLIAGPNNAGKSTLVRLLEAFFSDPDDVTMLDLKPLNAYYANEGPRALSRITIHFGRLTEEEEEAFAPLVRRDKTFWISLRSSRTGSVSFDASKKPGVDEARAFYGEVLKRFQFVKIPSVRVADGQVTGADSLERLLETLEAVLVRHGAKRSTALQQKYASAISPVESLVRDVLDESAAAIRADLPFQENVVRFRLPDARHALRGMLSEAVIESGGEVSVSVAERGTGFQSALVLGILRYVATQEAQVGGNMLFAIEEPEAFLHPQTQRAMAKIIRDISNDAQVLVTTHSSVLVDSFNVDQIARLPLQSGGLEHWWDRPDLEPADAGRLTRYCSASNSELVFANAVIFVEGEGDHATLEKLLGRLCGAPGGHYAQGITVVEASGISKIRYLVRLAELFGVRSYVLADRDSLHKPGGRQLLEILKERSVPPSASKTQRIHRESDKASSNLKEAIARQKVLNGELAAHDAFVLAADLEGLLLDMFGLTGLVDALGPSGHQAIDRAFAEQLLRDADGHEQMAQWLGSKGWNSTNNKSGKLQPHLPALLVDEWLDAHDNPGRVLGPLLDWLSGIIENASPAPV